MIWELYCSQLTYVREAEVGGDISSCLQMFCVLMWFPLPEVHKNVTFTELSIKEE